MERPHSSDRGNCLSIKALLLAGAAMLSLAGPGSAAARSPGSGWSLALSAGLAAGTWSDNSFRVVDERDRVPRLYADEGGVLLRAAATNRLLPGLDAGVEVTAWSRALDDSPGDAHLDALLLLPSLGWHPGGGGLSLRAGMGLGVARLPYQQLGEIHAGRFTGAAVLLAAGWDVPLGERWTLVPRAGYSGFAAGGLDVWVGLLSVSCGVGRRF